MNDLNEIIVDLQNKLFGFESKETAALDGGEAVQTISLSEKQTKALIGILEAFQVSWPFFEKFEPRVKRVQAELDSGQPHKEALERIRSILTEKKRTTKQIEDRRHFYHLVSALSMDTPMIAKSNIPTCGFPVKDFRSEEWDTVGKGWLKRKKEFGPLSKSEMYILVAYVLNPKDPKADSVETRLKRDKKKKKISL